MPTGPGKTRLTMATCGFRTNPRTGLRIATATGCTSPITAGLGSATSLGAGPRITTGDGSGTATRGRGGPDPWVASIVRSGRRLTFRSGDGAAVLVSELALAAGVVSAGFPSDRATGSIRGGVDIVAASATSVA